MTEMAILNGRIDGVESKVENINKNVSQVNVKVGDMKDNVDLMVILLRGNKFDQNDKGMIGEHEDLKKRVERLEKFKDRMFWVGITAAGITGLNLVQLIHMVVGAFKGIKGQ